MWPIQTPMLLAGSGQLCSLCVYWQCLTHTCADTHTHTFFSWASVPFATTATEGEFEYWARSCLEGMCVFGSRTGNSTQRVVLVWLHRGHSLLTLAAVAMLCAGLTVKVENNIIPCIIKHVAYFRLSVVPTTTINGIYHLVWRIGGILSYYF